MSKVNVTCEGLKSLFESAKRVGTVLEWCELAIEWAFQADAELRRQRDENSALAARVAELEEDAARWTFLNQHWQSDIEGLPLYKFIASRSLRLGGRQAALDVAMAMHKQPLADSGEHQ